MVIDIPGQFAKLCPSYERAIDMTAAQRLAVVDGHLEACRRQSARGHWTYDLNRHLALVELRDALIGEAADQQVAA